MKLFLILFIFSILIIGCFSLLLSTKKSKKILLNIEKKFFFNKENEQYLTINTTILNRTKDTIKIENLNEKNKRYFSVSNNTYHIFSINNDTLNCITILPNSSKEIKITLLKNKNIKTNLNYFKIILNLSGNINDCLFNKYKIYSNKLNV